MTRRLDWAVLFLFCAVGAVPAWAQSSPDVEQAIAELESKWAAAQKDAKADVVEPLLADRFVSINTEGQLASKEQLLAHIKPGKWDEYGISDVKVIVYGHVAIATGLWRGKGVVGESTKVDLRERWTDTWVRMPGGLWQCVASQQTAIKQ
jgi:ketosteroid isomerase-like protein